MEERHGGDGDDTHTHTHTHTHTLGRESVASREVERLRARGEEGEGDTTWWCHELTTPFHK